MELKDAIQLITHQEFSPKGKNNWADLGCGTGTFTLALASILESDSSILAVDADQSALNKIPTGFNQITISTQKADFVNDVLQARNLQGVLMANSLHFVKDKTTFLNKLKPYLAPNACFLVIEYDSDVANQWVPHPVSFDALNKLFSEASYKSIHKLNTRPSIYGNRNIYASLIE